VVPFNVGLIHKEGGIIMYTQTLAKTISEAIQKLLASKGYERVVPLACTDLTETQEEVFGCHTDKEGYHDEDISLALDNIFVNTMNRHMYVLEMCDGEDDRIRYYFAELTVPLRLRQDADGGLVII
jgi:hypothetical protein